MKAQAILSQVGYDRDDTVFVLLNLTPAQFDTLQEALSVTDDTGSVEGGLTAILIDWLKSKGLTHGCNDPKPARTGYLLRRSV